MADVTFTFTAPPGYTPTVSAYRADTRAMLGSATASDSAVPGHYIVVIPVGSYVGDVLVATVSPKGTFYGSTLDGKLGDRVAGTASADDLGNISEQLTTLQSKFDAIRGPGDTLRRIQVRNADGAPVSGVACWIATDAEGQTVITDVWYTNNTGHVEFLLNAGVYYLFRRRLGYTFNNPQMFEISDD